MQKLLFYKVSLITFNNNDIAKKFRNRVKNNIAYNILFLSYRKLN